MYRMPTSDKEGANYRRRRRVTARGYVYLYYDSDLFTSTGGSTPRYIRMGLARTNTTEPRAYVKPSGTMLSHDNTLVAN
jgi:hypothetical protein